MVVRLHADDLGLHSAVDRAVFRAHEAGALGGASLLVTGPTFREAARQARESGLPVSLHLALVDTAPLSPPREVPSLVGPDGRFPPTFGAVARRYLGGHMRRDELRREVRRQFEAFAEAGLIGVGGLQLDGHQHLHLLPTVFDLALELGTGFGLAAFRRPRLSAAERRELSARTVGFRLAELLGQRAGRRAARRGVAAVPCWGVLYAGHLTLGRARAVLASLAPDTSGQLLCHPGDDDAALTAVRPNWGYRWEMELATALAFSAAHE